MIIIKFCFGGFYFNAFCMWVLLLLFGFCSNEHGIFQPIYDNNNQL